MSDLEIKNIITEILKSFEPIFKAHGGGAELVAIEPDAVVLRILGHCNNCALAPLTFGLGIEQQIRQNCRRSSR